MCHKRHTCPEFERRTVNGIEGACKNCGYIKSIEKTSFYCKIGLAVALVLFITSTCILY